MKQKLGLICVNESTIDFFVKQCERIVALREIEKGTSTMHVDVQANLIQKHQANPELFIKPPSPSFWQLCDLDDFIETPMHLAMGVIKSVSKLIHVWATKIGKGKILTDHLCGWILIMMKHCRVDSHRMAMYSSENKFPGWVADTFRTWCKLMPWLYSVLSHPEFEQVIYEPLHDDWKKWNKTNVQKFLKSRQIPYTYNAKINELKEIVQANLLPDGTLPPYKPTPLLEITPKHVQELVWHCHHLFKYGFSTQNLNEKEMVCHVKLFLSSLDYIDSRVNNDDSSIQKPIYLAKYNMISLLRALPNQKRDGQVFVTHKKEALKVKVLLSN